ncbi:hypothetical protein CK203_050336 [Vitis vinifera]|uniref:Reverse transcriptase domain-containing protein n=1 Tax=Vitis vinifera TaxID=29760 RepID=A0A438GZS7_VITVI|nr:hypothetical protein CK203_050336 [Vitis vinifera]
MKLSILLKALLFKETNFERNHVLEKKEFSPKWRTWMRGCLSSVSYAILVNRNAKGMLLRAEERSMLEGFKVNLDKSNLFGINLDQNHLSRLALMLDCKACDWPILYLGLPLGGNSIACGFWDPIPASMAAKIERLQRDFFGQGLGKVKEIILEVVVEVPRESTALWHQVILAFMGHIPMVGDANTLVRWSLRCPWKAIAQVF